MLKGINRINQIRENIAEGIVRVLSKYKLAPYSTLKNILNSGRAYKSAAELFESANKAYENYKDIRDFFKF